MAVAVEVGERVAEPTRSLCPSEEGYIERDGVRVFYEVYGEARPYVLLLPTWSILHSRVWKTQIPYLGRHFRVVSFDPRGNGRSDRPRDRELYAESEYTADALAVMDATRNRARAVLVSLSHGAQRALLLAAAHPERVLAAAFVAPFFPVSPIGGLRWRLMAHRRVLPLLAAAAARTRVAQVQRRPLDDGLRGLPRVVHRPAHVQRAPFDQADRGRDRVGARHRRRDHDRKHARRGGRAAHAPPPDSARAQHTLSAVGHIRAERQDHRPRGRQGAGQGDRRRADERRRRQPLSAGAQARRGQPRCSAT